MTNDCVSITKTLMMGVKVMTERYKKILAQKLKVSAREMPQKEFIYFPPQ